jgi:hypothetical protein
MRRRRLPCGSAVPFRKPASHPNLVRAGRACPGVAFPSSVCADRFLMLLEAVIVISKIRIGFVSGSFFGKPCIYNDLLEYGAISFFVLIALSGQPVMFAPALRLGGTVPVRREFL